MKTLAKLNELFNSSEIGVAILNVNDLSNFFYKMNDTLKRFLQYDEKEINRLSLMDITYSADTAKTLEMGRQILEGKVDEYTYEKRYKRKDHSIFWGRVNVSRISDSFLLLTIQDITHLKSLVENMQELMNPLSNEDINDYCKRINNSVTPYLDESQRREYFRVRLPHTICTNIYLQQVINGAVTSFSPSKVCIQNISAGGLCFRCKVELPILENFSTYFEFKLLGKQLKLAGNIVRHRKAGRLHEYGVVFEMNEPEREKLIRHLNNLSILIRNGVKVYDTDFCNEACLKFI